MIVVDRLSGILSYLARTLASRTTLGIAALVLAGSAVWSSYQDAVINSEAECRSDLSGQLDDLTAESFQRIELALVAVARGDQSALAAIADQAEAANPAFERARVRRVNAVAICAVDPIEEVSTFIRENRIVIGLMAFGTAGLVMIRASARTNRDIAHVQGTADEIHREVRTINDLTLGESSDAAESRRIIALPEAERTDAERRHLGDIQPPDQDTPPRSTTP